MLVFFFFNDTATTEIYTLSLHDALPISLRRQGHRVGTGAGRGRALRRPGSRLGALSLCPPAPLRRDHRRRGAADAARSARAPAEQVPAPENDLMATTVLEIERLKKRFGGVTA